MPRDMRSCHSTVCPNCNHEFACPERRQVSWSGGGLVSAIDHSAASRLAPSLPSPCFSTQANLASPSVPLDFDFPPDPRPSPPPPPPLQLTSQEAELQHLTGIVRALHQSGWYYNEISFEDSHDMLKDTKVGTFLVRNSSNPKFLFSLSVQTERGPTSVRLHYMNGFFRFEAQPTLHRLMPAFPNVIDLIQYYVDEFKRYNKEARMVVWVDNIGKEYSPIRIGRPLKKEPLSLKHLSRLAIHKAIQPSGKPKRKDPVPPHAQLELPSSLVAYLGEYPHTI